MPNSAIDRCLLHAERLLLVTTSSTSITIKWANSKLAEMLRKREEEEALLRGNRVRHKEDRDDDRPRGRRPTWSPQAVQAKPSTQRWSGRVDFTKPSPLRDRPRSESGATSFHFDVKQISKEVSPTYKGRPLSGFKAGSETPGADHEIYIGRELATEQARDIEAYITRPQAVEIDGAILEREPGRVYNDEIEEGFADLTLAHDARGVPSIFSNISDDAFERAEFWKAVHRCEREPRVQTILIDATKDPALVRQIIADDQLPASFREMAALAYADAEKPRDIDAPRIRPRAWKGDAEACGEVLVHLQSYDGFDPRRSGITYKSGRGGTVQHRIVAELPHELTAAERAALVLRFCEHLENLEKNDDGSTRGVMYTAAIHAPDAHNDARNYHLHVVFHDRPARLVPHLGMWDFEVEESFDRKGEIRTRYPYRQEKLRMVNGINDTTDPEVSGRNFIPALRREFSRITNEALERAGIERRYDPRTYKAMGIERTPTDHLGTKAAALEAAGVETTVGSLNAQKIWGDAKRDIERRTAQRKSAIESREVALVDLMGEAASEPAAAPTLTKLRSAVADWSRTATDVAEDRELVDGFDLMEAQARSRAEKVRSTCLRTLADIELGTAPSRDVKAKAKIEKRLGDASTWLAQIDLALDEGRPEIEKARKKIATDEERAEHLSQEVDRLADELRNALASSRSAAALASGRGVQKKPSRRPIEGEVGIVDIASLDAVAGPPAPPKESEASRAEANKATPTISEPAAPAKPIEPPAQAATAPAAGQHPISEQATKPAPAAPRPAAEKESSPPPTSTRGPSTDAPVPASAKPGIPPATKAPAQPEAQRPAFEQSPAPAPPKKAPEPSEPTPTAPLTPSPAPAPEPAPTKPEKAPPAPAEPALFDLPIQPAPARPGSTEERQKQWNDLFDKIQSENLFILPKQGVDASRLTVPSLSEAEKKLLETPELAKRSQARLEAMKKTQDYALDRLGKWLHAHSHDEAKIVFGDRTYVYRDTPKAIQTLLDKYKLHPEVVPQLERGMETQGRIREVVQWIRTDGRDGNNLRLGDGHYIIADHEKDMRDKLPEVIKYQPVKAALRAEYDRRQRELEARDSALSAERQVDAGPRSTIDPSSIRHPLVREFIKGLNGQRTPEQMHEIAKRIEITKQAREELLALGQEAGVAYTRATNMRPDSKAPPSRRDRDRGF